MIIFLNVYGYAPRPLEGMLGCSGGTLPVPLVPVSRAESTWAMLFEFVLSKTFCPHPPAFCLNAMKLLAFLGRHHQYRTSVFWGALKLL